ncbi:hypothetical protein Trydic_g15738 [Trypoxylus dichotomus]
MGIKPALNTYMDIPLNPKNEDNRANYHPHIRKTRKRRSPEIFAIKISNSACMHTSRPDRSQATDQPSRPKNKPLRTELQKRGSNLQQFDTVRFLQEFLCLGFT